MSEYLHHPKKEIPYLLAVSLSNPAPTKAPSNTNLLTVSMDFIILNVSYEGNHITGGLSCLISFIYCNVLKDHPCCGI